MATKKELRAKKALKKQSKNIEPTITWYKDKLIIVLMASLVVVTAIVFSPILNNEFLNFDDNVLIYENPVVANNGDFSFKDIFSSKLFMPHYKPLVFLQWNLEYRIFGFDPFYFHLHNLLLHLLNVILVFFIAKKLIKRFSVPENFSIYSAFFIAIIFAIHPMRAESVAWATERKDVLFSFFFLLSSWFYIKYTENSKKFIWLGLSVLFYVLTILSKSMGITLLAVLFLYDFLYDRKLNTRLFIEKIPHLIVFLIAFYLYGLFSKFGQEASGLSVGIVNQGFDYYPENFKNLNPFYTRILIINIRLILWIAHLIFPYSLSAIYPKKEILESLGNFIHIFPLITLGLLALSIRVIKKYKWFAFGLLFFIITISPAIAIAEEGISVFLSDRYTYMASIGIIMIVVMALTRLASKKNNKMLLIVPMSIVALLFSVVAFGQNKVWNNSETFWTNVISVSKNETSAYNGRGKYYRQQNDYDKALIDYNKAIECDPENYKAYTNRGKIFFDRGKYKESINDFSKTIELDPNYFEAWSNRGAAYATIKNYSKALSDIDKALEIKPNHSNSFKNRALVYMELGENKKAIDDFNTYQKLTGKDANIINSIGACYLNMKDYSNAIKEFSKAISMMPNQGIFYRNRAWSYYYAGKLDKAKTDANKALQFKVNLKPEFRQALGI